jgi:hypothetical protein
MDEPERKSSGLMSALDTAEAVASTIYVVMLAILAIAVVAALGYLVLHPPTSWGAQGEMFYLAVAFLLVIFWIMTQAAWLIKRRRRKHAAPTGRLVWSETDVQMRPSGLSFKWGSQPREASQESTVKPWTWNFDSGPIATHTFKLDQAQLDQARTAREAGKSWEDIAKQVNPDYGFLNPFDQSLYQRALQLAVDAQKGV